MDSAQTYSPFTFSPNSSKGNTTAATFSERKRDEKPHDLWLNGMHILDLYFKLINVLHHQCSLYHTLRSKKPLVPPTYAEAVPSDNGELSHLKQVEKDLATEYGLLSDPIDSVDVLQMAKDRAFDMKDEKSKSDLAELDTLFKLQLKLNTDDPLGLVVSLRSYSLLGLLPSSVIQ
ncbi:hypothetical protein EDD18DRAFT_1368520 [Armillaria luteobubalina]|uniref:Uncharacterized protein n=1 Tax=Armillaria luteobubalina TaxID=153913 RepID=A0AA39T9H5_9AGAR|nr:hypothetical protein EDD18DRAFT_1368520 [Armillaria luteobubalina]